MTTDAPSREPGPRWELPDILHVRIKRIRYRPPKRRYFESYLATYSEAVEFLVETNGPFPMRALSPVLYVGDVAVTENEGVRGNVYRFLAFEFDQLEKGAPISLGWPGQPEEQRGESKFRYEL